MQDNGFPTINIYQDVLLEYNSGLNLERVLDTNPNYGEYCRYELMGYCLIKK